VKEKILNAIKDYVWNHSAPYVDLDDRHLHDHPFNYMTLILKGGYWEHLQDGSRTWYGPGSIRFAKANTLHRLELPEGQDAWTLFFTGTRIRKWGFQTEDGWIDFKTYLDKKHGQNGTNGTPATT
jgi:hypothetical protein